MSFCGRLSALLLLTLACACSSGSNSRPVGGGDAGALVIGLPDGPGACRDTASVPLIADGGAPDPLCSSSMPAVSFAADVLPIFSACSGEVCHAPWRYDTLVGQHSVACCDHRWLVVPGQPSPSHVVQAVRGSNACVPQMPLDEGALSNPEIAAIVAWVCQGALDN